MNVMFSANSTTSVSLGLVNVNQTVRKNIDNTKHVSVKKYRTENKAKDALKAQKIDGIIFMIIIRINTALLMLILIQLRPI